MSARSCIVRAESLTLNRTLPEAISTVGQETWLGKNILLSNDMEDPYSNYPLRPE